MCCGDEQANNKPTENQILLLALRIVNGVVLWFCLYLRRCFIKRPILLWLEHIVT